VLTLVDDTEFHYAGDSIGGAVGLQLLLDAPERVSSATLLCTGAVIGDPESWHARAATVHASGTEAVVDSSAQRWFGVGFADRQPAAATALLDAPENLRRIATSVKDGRLVVLDGVGHLAPAEAPQRVADLIRGQAATATATTA
jgi:3-oxoadipate enol-lactonase / 4-carboxymuconolactone decarboxylase